MQMYHSVAHTSFLAQYFRFTLTNTSHSLILAYTKINKMKKILFAFVLVAGFSAASYAQSSSSATAEPAKVEVAGQTHDAVTTDKASAPSSSSSSTKSCCSHK